MAKLGIPFTGALFAGLMIGADGGLTVLEYNVRFGDPETEVLMDLLDGDFGRSWRAAASSDDRVLALIPSRGGGRPAAKGTGRRAAGTIEVSPKRRACRGQRDPRRNAP
jgi:hypothetical protein